MAQIDDAELAYLRSIERHERRGSTIKGLSGMAIFFMVVAGAFGASANETMILASALGMCVATAMMQW